VVRVTDRSRDLAQGDSSHGLKNEYSRVQSFNSDESRILVRGLAATWYLYDAVTLTRLKKLPFDGPVEPRWDETDPKVLYYCQDGKFFAYDTTSGTTRVVRDFHLDFPGQELTAVWSRHEGSPSLDGRYFGLMAEDQDWNPAAFLIYDRVADQIVAKRAVVGLPNIESTDSVCISPLANYFVAFLDPCPAGESGSDSRPCGLMVYDRQLKNGRGLHRGVGHCDLALEAEGREILVFQDSFNDTISKLDLATGAVTSLRTLDFGANLGLGLHISGRAARTPGWILISTHDGSKASHTWMDDGVFAMETKPNGCMVRLAHTHSLVDPEQEHDYWAEPHATANRDLSRVLFTSNWGRSGADQVEMYLIILQPGWAAPAVSGSADAPPIVEVNSAADFNGAASLAGCSCNVNYRRSNTPGLVLPSHSLSQFESDQRDHQGGDDQQRRLRERAAGETHQQDAQESEAVAHADAPHSDRGTSRVSYHHQHETR
jgi:hypothetical protein